MRVDELERELQAEGPQPSHDFARRLDEWAEAGFPRDRGLGPRTGSRAGALRQIWDRFSDAPPRRLLLPAGAVATVVLVAGVAISRYDTGGTELSPSSGPPSEAAQAPRPAGGADRLSTKPAQGTAGAAESATPGSTGDVIEPLPAPVPAPGGERLARGQNRRIVDASARVALGAPADEVQEVANGIVEVTDRYHGVVADSQVTSDETGARASFTLELPYKRLDAALADLSGLADVVSRTEATEDITARAVRARKDLARTLEQLRKARIELIRADTSQQRLVIKSRIASLEANADAQRTELNAVERQGRFATVSVDVTSSEGASGDGDWSLGDALGDAGRVLEVIAGVALVSLAILLPLSLVGALVAFTVGRARRRSRENALGE